jgi:hypothetical protein
MGRSVLFSDQKLLSFPDEDYCHERLQPGFIDQPGLSPDHAFDIILTLHPIVSTVG